MIPLQLLADVAADLTGYLSHEIGFTVEDKESSTFMEAVASGMDLASHVADGLATSDAFMTRYATTIGNTVYLPKLIRDNPRSVIEVVPHEGQHSVQYQASEVKFAWLYLTEAADRAQVESDAYATGLSIRAWLTGQPIQVGDLQWILSSLVQGYHLRESDKDYARVALLSHVQSIHDGITMTTSARATVAFLERKYPQLKGALSA